MAHVLLVLVTWFMFTPAAGVANTPTMVSYADLVERLSPAVVNISTKTNPRQLSLSGGQRQNPFAGTPFELFFQDFQQGFDNLYTPPSQSLGSGVIIDATGFIVTNHHVVQGADAITVKLHNNPHEFPAKLIGSDAKNDIALLKINATKPLPFTPLGNSRTLRVGDAVLAIGNPFGLGGSVTSGIVSALGRSIGQGPYDDFIQTDAAINPGNSGGPLFNAAGQVVGINTAIFTRSGGSNGIGFAVPASTVSLVVQQLKQFGAPRRSWLGVKIQDLTPDLASSLGLTKPAGALVAEVTADSPAAGILQAGDVITHFNGTAVAQASDLPRQVAYTPIGTRVQLQLMRQGRARTVQVTLAQQPQDDTEGTATPSSTQQEEVDDTTSIGLALQPVPPAAAQQYELPPEAASGLWVVQAMPGGVAAQAGIQRGDVIVAADGKPITSVAQLRRAFARREGATLLLRLWRPDSGFQFLALKVPA